MKKLPIYLALVALAGVVTCVAMFAIEQSPQTSIDSQFPATMLERTALQPEDSPEFMRVYSYAEDGYTRLSAVVHYRDGSRGFIHYRPDGTVSEFGSSYVPSQSGVEAPKLEAAYAVDGQSLLFEKHYREDGRMSRQGKRLPDGNYLVREFFEEGFELAAEELFDKEAKLLSLTHWYPGGQVKETFLTEPNGANVTNKYRADGSLEFYHRMRYKSEVWENYREDGSTLSTRFEMIEQSAMRSVSYHVLAQHFRQDGSLEIERLFHRSKMEVRFYNENGSLSFVQQWNHKNWSGVTESDLKMTADQYTLHGIYLGKEPFDKDSFWFYDGGEGKLRRHMYRVRFPEDPPSTRRSVYREYDKETGFLKEWSRYFRSGDKVQSEIVKPEDSKEKFDYSTLPEGWDVMVPYQVPPKPPYDYEGDD